MSTYWKMIILIQALSIILTGVNIINLRSDITELKEAVSAIKNQTLPKR